MSRIEDRIIAGLAQLSQEIAMNREVLKASLATSQAGQRLRGDRPVAIGVGGVRLAWAGPGRLTGWTLANPSAAPATVRFRDSRNDTGTPVAVVVVPAGSSRDLVAGRPGVSFGEGLFVDVVGTVEGVAWIGSEA